MNILIAYGSTEGHTRKIANHINSLVGENGHSSVVYDCGGFDPKPEINEFDAIIVAGSVHQELHQPHVAEFVRENLSVLNSKPAAFISVSLSISFPEGKPEAEKYISGFIEESGWQPQHVHMAAGAIRFLEYDYFKRLTIEHIVLQGNKMPDKQAGNPEYTDWNALDAFVEEFVNAASSV